MRYRIHEVVLEISTADEQLASAVHGLLARYSLHVTDDSPQERPVSCGLRSVESLAAEPATEGLFFDEGGLQCSYAKGRIDLRARGLGIGKADMVNGTISIEVLSDRAGSSWSVQHFLILPLVLEFLRLEGIHPIHAAAVETDGAAVLLPAAPGSGKSTLSLALLRSGARLLSDDMPFLTIRSGHAEVLAFPEDINVCASGTGFFPELAFLDGRQPNERDKHSFPVEQMFGDRIIDRARPRLLVYPSIAGTATSTLQPISKGDAFEDFLEHCLPPLNRSLARDHFETMMEVVSGCECYRLAAGTDPNEAAGLLLGLLREG